MRRTRSGGHIPWPSWPSRQPSASSFRLLDTQRSSANFAPPLAFLSIDQPTLDPEQANSTTYKILHYTNESTKWAVSALVLIVFLRYHDLYAAWCVTGAVFSSFLCKVLKHVINEQRPEYARKSDPGMPSSHANSLNFLSVYAALTVNYFSARQPGGAAAVGVLTAACLAGGLFLTWLRVALGFHTWPQVIVGAVLGSATAVAWFYWGVRHAVQAIQGTYVGPSLLYAVCGLAMTAFAVKNVHSWWKERREEVSGQGLGQTSSGSTDDEHIHQDVNEGQEQRASILQQPDGHQQQQQDVEICDKAMQTVTAAPWKGGHGQS